MKHNQPRLHNKKQSKSIKGKIIVLMSTFEKNTSNPYKTTRIFIKLKTSIKKKKKKKSRMDWIEVNWNILSMDQKQKPFKERREIEI